MIVETTGVDRVASGVSSRKPQRNALLRRVARKWNAADIIKTGRTNRWRGINARIRSPIVLKNQQHDARCHKLKGKRHLILQPHLVYELFYNCVKQDKFHVFC